MLTLHWTKLLSLDQSIINTQDFGPGVYRLSYKSADGSYYVFYIGRSDASVKERLLQHISESEENLCIKINIKNLECYFKFAPVDDQTERENIERTLYEHFKPRCNNREPEGEFVEINFK